MNRLLRKASPLAVALVSLVILGCGEDAPPGRVAVAWTIGSGVSCDDAEVDIDSVRVTLTDIADEDVRITTTSYCAANSAVLDLIPAGTYDLLLEGVKGSDFATAGFRGEKTGVIVLPGQTTTVGELAMEFLPPLPDPGTLQLSWGFESGLCGANEVTKVRIVIWQKRLVKSYEKSHDCNIDAPGYISVSLSPNTYDVRIFGSNDQQQTIMTGGKDGLVITEGGTTSAKDTDGVTLKAVQTAQ